VTGQTKKIDFLIVCPPLIWDGVPISDAVESKAILKSINFSWGSFRGVVRPVVEAFVVS